MRIRTYENSVQHGVIDTLKHEDKIRDLSARAQDVQRILTAPASIQQQENLNESAEAAAAENIEKGAKSLSGAFGEFVGNEFQRLRKKGVQGVSKQTASISKRGTTAAAHKMKSVAQQAAGKTVRGIGKGVSQSVKVTMKSTAAAAGTAAKTAASASAGAATAGVSTAVQAGVEAGKKAVLTPLKKVQEGAEAAARNGGRQAAQVSEMRAADMARAAEAAREGMESIASQAQPKGWTKFAFAVVGIALILYTMFAGISAGSSAGHAVNLNERVESYRPSVQKWAAEYGIPEYVEVLLALCMAETGILDNPGDPFACSESGLAVKQPDGITDPEYSIEIGVYCFSLKLQKAKCASPSDRNNLFKALQAYNMGDGFIDFCDTYYGGIWSVECARAFSEKMGQGGVYGNPNYIEQFLRCYEFGSTVSNFSGALNAAGLCWPLGDVGQDSITQHFGGMYSGEPHKGLDIGVPEGTPIYAAADGKVTVANDYDSWGYSWGYYVKINHSSVHDTLYAHMSRVAVTEGQYVKQGDLIGYVGSTGNSSGPHLHFELYLDGTRVDPEPYIGTDALKKYLTSKI